MIVSLKPGVNKIQHLETDFFFLFFNSYTILKIKIDLICQHMTFTNHNTTLSLDPFSEEKLFRSHSYHLLLSWDRYISCKIIYFLEVTVNKNV